MSGSTSDNPLRGILTILGAVACFTISDAMAKLLGRDMPVMQINWIRYLVFVPFSIVLVMRTAGGRVRVRNPAQQIVRGLLLAVSAVLFMASIQVLPLAEATAIGFMSPLLITALSVVVLREVVGLRRWLAVLVGLLGMLVVVRPGTEAFQPAALFTLASSSCWAFAVVLTRRMAGHDPTATTLLWSSVVGLVAMSAVLPFGFVWPTPGQWVLALALGVVASTGQYLMVQAYRFAAASVLAPFSYTALLWSTLSGWALFGALPDMWTLVGAAIIAASGLQATRTEQASARNPAPRSPG